MSWTVTTHGVEAVTGIMPLVKWATSAPIRSSTRAASPCIQATRIGKRSAS